MSTEWARELLKAAGLYARDKALCDEVLSTLARHGALHPLEAHGRVVWRHLMREAVEVYGWGVVGDVPDQDALDVLSAADLVARIFNLGDDAIEWTRACRNVLFEKTAGGPEPSVGDVLRTALAEADHGVLQTTSNEDLRALLEALLSGHLPVVGGNQAALSRLSLLVRDELEARGLAVGGIGTPMCRACGVAYVVEGSDLCLGCTALHDAGALMTDAGPVGG